jgi:hypothetical protein
MTLLFVLWLQTQTVLPKGVILVKGAVPSASDASTPVPEDGRVAEGRYRNRYFGLTYEIPAGWTEQPAGPPPSDSGAYVLGEFALADATRVKAHVLITAQDLFFEPHGAASAKDVVAAARRMAAPSYDVEPGAETVTIADRAFSRLAYKSRHTPLRWRIVSTDVRCHALTFTFTGADTAALDAAEKALGSLALHDDGPPCVRDYVHDHLLSKSDPGFPQRYNTIPVRLIIDAEGNVKHIHLLSAFPEQSAAILASVRTWRFAPHVVDGKATEVETGMVFGLPRPVIP